MAVAGHQAAAAVLDADEQPVAVELDLAEPVLALRRRLRDGAELRRLRVRRQRAAHRAGRRAASSAPGRAAACSGERKRDFLLPARVASTPGALVLVVALDEEPGSCRSRSRAASAGPG